MNASDEAEGFTEMIVDAAWINELVADRDRLRTALTMLKTSIEQDPAMDTQIDRWMLGIIDTALEAGQ